MTVWTPINPSAASLAIANPGMLDVRDYGAVGDGIADDSAAINAALADIANGGSLILPPGIYLCNSQLTLTKTALGTKPRAAIFGYGAEIRTTGAISGLQLKYGYTWGGISVYGLTINHRGNATATYGFELVRTWDCKLYDCTVVGHGTQASYAAYICRNETASDASTGCFWTAFINCKTRRQGGGDGTQMAQGIRLQGAANATSIIACNLSDTETNINIQPESGQTYVANGVLIEGCWFEGFTTGILADNTAGSSPPSGLRIMGCRFELGTTAISYGPSTTTQPATPPYMAGNYIITSVTTFLSNPNSLYYTSLDASITPLISSHVKTDFSIDGTSGSTWPLTLKCIGGSRGLLLQNATGGSVGLLVWTGTGTECELKSGAANDLYVSGVQGISNTLTKAQNLRGSATFVSAATVAVTLAPSEADASYYVALSGNAYETFWVTAKGTGGFTLNSSNASSVAVVDWHLIR